MNHLPQIDKAGLEAAGRKSRFTKQNTTGIDGSPSTTLLDTDRSCASEIKQNKITPSHINAPEIFKQIGRWVCSFLSIPFYGTGRNPNEFASFFDMDYVDYCADCILIFATESYILHSK